MVKNLPASTGDARDMGLIPVSGRSPGVGNGNPLQHSCLENSMDREAWQAAVHEATKSRTRLSTHAICSVSLAALIIVSIFYFSHSNSCVVVSHCGFNLHFSNR